MSQFIKKNSPQQYATWSGGYPPINTFRQQQTPHLFYSPCAHHKPYLRPFDEEQQSWILERKQSEGRRSKQESYCHEQPRYSFSSTSNQYQKWEKNSKNKSADLCPAREKEIQGRFQEIEELFGKQNENLKQQKRYLQRVIQKMKEKEKQYQNQLKNYQTKMQQLQTENKILKGKYEEARIVISNGIGQIEDAVKMKEQQKQEMLVPPLGNIHGDTTSSLNITDLIQELSDKFDALMFEYQKTKTPQARKQCMEIAKEIKRVKKENGISSMRPSSHQ